MFIRISPDTVHDRRQTVRCRIPRGNVVFHQQIFEQRNIIIVRHKSDSREMMGIVNDLSSIQHVDSVGLSYQLNQQKLPIFFIVVHPIESFMKTFNNNSYWTSLIVDIIFMLTRWLQIENLPSRIGWDWYYGFFF